MERRTFLKLSSLGTMGFLVPLPKEAKEWLTNIQEDDLLRIFENPSHDAFPYTWWHWMNGNVTKEGIQLDLDFLHRSGIGGFQLFQVGTGIPKGPVDFGSNQWLDLLKFAAEYASRLGLEFDMMNCGGWSSSGGPWITPELGMQQLSWAEIQIKGGQKVNLQLPRPYIKLNYYQDTYVLAFPTPGEKHEPIQDLVQQVLINQDQQIDTTVFTTGAWADGVNIDHADNSGYYSLQVEFKSPFHARSITLFGGITGSFSFLGPQAQNINQVELQVSSDGKNFESICNLNLSVWRNNSLEVPVSKNFNLVTAKFFRIRSSRPLKVYYIRLLSSECLLDWPLKANYTRLDGIIAGQQITPMFNAHQHSIVPVDQVLDISAYVDKNGYLSWDAPEGNWTIVRFGYTPVGIQNHPSPDGGGGLECDKYSSKAYDFHFDHFFGKLYNQLENLGKASLSGAIIDSYEVGMQTWTPDLPIEFSNRRGYSMVKYMPALVGYIVGDPTISDKFLWDVRRTHADLMADNYYGRFAELCRQHNMKSYVEPYSGGPFDEIQVGAKVDVPMGEFWAGMDQANGVFYSIKLASSIAHVYGKKIVAAESYTGIPSQTKWQLHPYAMKGQGDWMYTLGLNKFIFHVYAMQPHPTAKPGMTMGPWGWMHSRNNTWADQEKYWIAYVQRTQSLLQEGLIIADILYFVGEEVPVNTPVLPEQLFPKPSEGYYYDVIDREGILSRVSVRDGKITLPDGVTYSLLVLPNTQVISLDLLQKIRDLVYEGAHVLVNSRPSATPGLKDYPKSEELLKSTVNELWDKLDGENVKEISFGKGAIYWNIPIKDILIKKLSVLPDFEFSTLSGDAPINFIHRKIQDADVYFIANRRRSYENIVCTFRVKGKKPEIWNPLSKEILEYPVYEKVDNRIKVAIQLEPAGSRFIVFRNEDKNNTSIVSINTDKPIISTSLNNQSNFEKYKDVINNFSISCFIKPETEISLSTNAGWIGFPVSWVFFPLSGVKLYGTGHANCGLTIGRNGIIVYEREDDQLIPVLVIDKPISGWSHVVLVYDSGVPSVYLNGEFLAQGERSKYLIHPGLDQSLQDEGATYFHGEVRNLFLHESALTEAQIKKLFKSRFPEPDPPNQWDLKAGTANEPYHLFFFSGNYSITLSDKQKLSLPYIQVPDPIFIQGPWELNFPEGLGAPSKIILNNLISLKDHEIDGVKYFSGTVTYRNTFNIPISYISPNIRLFLDLGWVEVIAEVWINDHYVNTSWTIPHRMDITDFVHSGKNNLLVKVTNLWPNRLIGDEQLPSESEYNGGGNGPRAEFMASIKKLPDWYVEGKPKPPGGRITFTTWKHFSKDDPLLDSGLIGPVKIIPAYSRKIDIS